VPGESPGCRWVWELGLHRGTPAGRGLDTQPAAEGLHPVPESEKAGAAVESGAVTHPDPKDVVVDDYVDVDDRGVGVLGVVGQRLGDDVVRGVSIGSGSRPTTPTSRRAAAATAVSRSTPATGRIGAVTPPGQVTAPAPRSMSNRSLLNNPPAGHPGGPGAGLLEVRPGRDPAAGPDQEGVRAVPAPLLAQRPARHATTRRTSPTWTPTASDWTPRPRPTATPTGSRCWRSWSRPSSRRSNSTRSSTAR
jgi:hypothetical protein